MNNSAFINDLAITGRVRAFNFRAAARKLTFSARLYKFVRLVVYLLCGFFFNIFILVRYDDNFEPLSKKIFGVLIIFIFCISQFS